MNPKSPDCYPSGVRKTTNKKNFLAALRPFAGTRNKAATVETCGFCSAPLASQHRHLMEIPVREIICVCNSCALRFENVIGRFKLIPRESHALPHFQLADSQWKQWQLPSDLTFIYQSSDGERTMAICPEPNGIIERPISFESWHEVIAENPELENLKPDVEALLINRIGDARDYFITPIDVCFELAGLLRKNRRGFSGRNIVSLEIETFFEWLREQTARIALRTAAEKIYA